MNEATIRATILEILSEIAPDTDPSTLSDTDQLRVELGIDSFDALQFIIQLDERLGIEIPEEDYNRTGSIADILGYIREQKG
jgi:acyl carrier protein